MNRVRAFAAVAGLLAATACQPGLVHTPKLLLAPRIVVVYADVSASRRIADDSSTVSRVISGLRSQDRLLVFPTGRGLGELRPVLDTVLPGSALDRMVQLAGLEVGRNARAATEARQLLEKRVMHALSSAVHEHGAPSESRLLEAVCHAGELARAAQVDGTSTDTPTRVIGLLLSDGVEESPQVNVSARVPSTAAARSIGARLHADQGCSLKVPGLQFRVIGLRHRSDTPALSRWWVSVLTALGANVRPGDVSPSVVIDLLS